MRWFSLMFSFPARITAVECGRARMPDALLIDLRIVQLHDVSFSATRCVGGTFAFLCRQTPPIGGPVRRPRVRIDQHSGCALEPLLDVEDAWFCSPSFLEKKPATSLYGEGADFT